jgi:aspartyl-tRNA synthetase
MEFVELNDLVKGKISKYLMKQNWLSESMLKDVQIIQKQIDELVDWVKRPQIGASGMVWVKFQNDGVKLLR